MSCPHFLQTVSQLITVSVLDWLSKKFSWLFFINFSFSSSKLLINSASNASMLAKLDSKCKHCSSIKSSMGDKELADDFLISLPASSLTVHLTLTGGFFSRVLMPCTVLRQVGEVNDEAKKSWFVFVDKGSENFLKSFCGGDKSCAPTFASNHLLQNENRMAGSESRFSGKWFAHLSGHRFIKRAHWLESSVDLFSSMLFRLE